MVYRNDRQGSDVLTFRELLATEDVAEFTVDAHDDDDDDDGTTNTCGSKSPYYTEITLFFLISR